MRCILKRIYLIISILFAYFIISYDVTQGTYNLESLEVTPHSSANCFIETVGNLLTVDIKDATLDEVLKQISDQNGITFLLPHSLSKNKIMLKFSKLKIDDGLNRILAPYNRISIYSAENGRAQEPSPTRLTEVRIFPIHEENNKNELGGNSVIYVKNSKPDLETKEYGSKSYGMKESRENSEIKPVATLSKAIKDKDPTVKAEAVREFSTSNTKNVTDPLGVSQKDKSLEVSKEKVMDKTVKNTNNDNAGDTQTDQDEEKPLPSNEGSPSFAIEYHNDSTDQGDNSSGKEVSIGIKLNDITEQVISAGFLIHYNPSEVSIVNADVYDGSALPGPWDHEMTRLVKDVSGSGTYLVGCGNLGNVAPDESSGITIAKIRFLCKGKYDTPITISTVSGLDTVVGGNTGTVYDSKIKPLTFTIH